MKRHREFTNDGQRERYLRLRWSPTRDDSGDDGRSEDGWDHRLPGDADDYLLAALWNRIKFTPRLEERFPKTGKLFPQPQSRPDLPAAPRITPATLALELSRLAAMGKSKAIAAIKASITNGWQGLFKPKDRGQYRRQFRAQQNSRRDIHRRNAPRPTGDSLPVFKREGQSSAA